MQHSNESISKKILVLNPKYHNAQDQKKIGYKIIDWKCECCKLSNFLTNALYGGYWKQE